MSVSSVSGKTDLGRVRANNEDSFICRYVWDRDHILLAAIDGVGGYEGGEVAAEIARSVITDYVLANTDNVCLDMVKQAVVEANNSIVRRKESDETLSGMGCVATVALLDLAVKRAYMAHVGDSRLYVFRDGMLTKLSHDHSIVGYREEMGDLTEEEAMRHPRRNIIDRALGDMIHMADDPNFIDAAIFPIESGVSKFLLCSDGLSDMLTSRQIVSVLAEDLDPEMETDSLVDMANEAGGRDNVTVVIARIDIDDPDTGAAVGISHDTAGTGRRCRSWRRLLIYALVVISVIAAGIFIFHNFYATHSADAETVMADSVDRLGQE